jgi:hypothetical protein
VAEKVPLNKLESITIHVTTLMLLKLAYDIFFLNEAVYYITT